MLTSLPLYYYQMRKIILDDDNHFSQSIILTMSGKNFISFNSPNELLNFLSNDYKPVLTNKTFINTDFDSTTNINQKGVSINISELASLMKSPPKNDISALLIDYHMPVMNGVELLEKIKDQPFKKALITGENDYKIAVDAFNQGLVDVYLRKDDSKFTQKISEMTNKLEWDYFKNLTRFSQSISDFEFLNNKNVASQFERILTEKSISRFYLSNTAGNFTAYDQKGNSYQILIRNKSQLKQIANVGIEDGASTYTINSIVNNHMIPYFSSKEYWEAPANQWEPHLHPLNEIPNESNYVWSIISGQ